jgi:hypothetical protein
MEVHQVLWRISKAWTMVMQLLLLIIATATVVLSGGLLLVLYLIPSSSLVSNALSSGHSAVIVADAIALAILLVATIAGVSVLVRENRRTSGRLNRLANTMVIAAAALGVIDLSVDIALPAHRARSIWWLDLLLIVLALAYWVRQRTERQTVR